MLYYSTVDIFAGISMHKGFAFIQFTNPFDARSACLGEDGRTVLGQTLGKSTKLWLRIIGTKSGRTI